MDTNIDIAQEIYKKNVELLEQRRRTEQLLYSVSEVVFAVDSDLHFTLFNHTAESLLNVKSEEVLGKDVDDYIKLFKENGTPLNASDYCFLIDSSKEIKESVILNTVHGGYFVNIKTSVIVNAEGEKECIVTLVDVTKEKQLDKLKDDFISITSHELRTPITIIKSYLWMLNSGKAGTLNEKQLEYLNKAAKGSERMLALINDTLNVSRIEQGKIAIKLDRVNLPSFLKEFEDEFKIKTEEKGLYLKADIPEGAWDIYADKMRLREVFVNFLGNSAKFTDTGGITIKAEDIHPGFIKVSIIDTGPGIKKEDLPRLFNKFGRLDNNFTNMATKGGTGLGLYICKILVEKMGGKVGVESEGEGKGSTFWFILPAADPDSKICSLVS